MIELLNLFLIFSVGFFAVIIGSLPASQIMDTLLDELDLNFDKPQLHRWKFLLNSSYF